MAPIHTVLILLRTVELPYIYIQAPANLISSHYHHPQSLKQARSQQPSSSQGLGPFITTTITATTMSFTYSEHFRLLRRPRTPHMEPGSRRGRFSFVMRENVRDMEIIFDPAEMTEQHTPGSLLIFI